MIKKIVLMLTFVIGDSYSENTQHSIFRQQFYNYNFEKFESISCDLKDSTLDQGEWKVLLTKSSSVNLHYIGNSKPDIKHYKKVRRLIDLFNSNLHGTNYMNKNVLKENGNRIEYQINGTKKFVDILKDRQIITHSTTKGYSYRAISQLNKFKNRFYITKTSSIGLLKKGTEIKRTIKYNYKKGDLLVPTAISSVRHVFNKKTNVDRKQELKLEFRNCKIKLKEF